MTRPQLGTLLKMALGIALVAMLWNSGLLDPGRILEAFKTQPLWVLLAFALHGAIFLVLGARWSMIAHRAGIPLPVGLAQKLTFVSHFFSSLLPGNGAGEVAKAWILTRHGLGSQGGTRTLRNADGSLTEIVKRPQDLPPPAMLPVVGTMVLDRFCGMTGLFLAWCTCLTASLVLSPAKAPVLVPVLAGAATVLIAMLAVLWLLPSLGGRLEDRLGRSRWQKWLRPVSEGLTALREAAQDRGTVVRALGLSLVSQLLFYAACTACARALGHDLAFLTLGTTMPLAALSNSIPATPGGVGIGEFTAGSFFSALGFAKATGAEIMLLLRLVLWALAAAGFVVWLTLRRTAAKEPS